MGFRNPLRTFGNVVLRTPHLGHERQNVRSHAETKPVLLWVSSRNLFQVAIENGHLVSFPIVNGDFHGVLTVV